MKIVIVTGMSGAGKSSALRIFEDMGYFCMDNLPPQLMGAFLALAKKSTEPLSRVAIGVDIRSRTFFEEFKAMIELLQEEGEDLSILFLEADEEILIRRYKELRRPHPLDQMGNIYDGIQREKGILEPLRRRADHVINSSHLSLGELKRQIDSIYLSREGTDPIMISVTSFGFKHGILLDADLVMDVRFLPNPYYQEDLKGKSGLDEEVARFVLSADPAQQFLKHYIQLLQLLIPYYIHEGKRTLVLGIGCTGGQHRSVVMAEAIGRAFQDLGYAARIYHRDRSAWKLEGRSRL